ncbi:hypothetical protein KEM48_004658 [Puccinia striiformis f. sp. tritici PST-130]|nr:hypothetical protein KEM48_004658 [Puccinia striiformis f. sp. tritici PST-130]
MLARLSSPSGFGTDLLDFKIAAALAENKAQEIMVLIQTLTASTFNLSPVRALILELTKTVRRPPVTITSKLGPPRSTLPPCYQESNLCGVILYSPGSNQPHAREIFNQKGIPVKQWCKEVAEKWHTLTPEIKMKYKDYDFIKTLRGDVPVELVNGTIQTTRQVHVANTALNLGSNKRGIAFAQRWIKDMIAEMNQLAASQGIQGMLIIASVRSSGDLFIQGGTNLGRNFISMLRKGGDPIKKFQTYIAGMAAAEEVCGGPVCTNKKIIGAKMKELLNAAGGKYFKAWPGSNVVRDLNAASIQLKVKRNAADFQVKELCQPVNTLLLDSSQRILQAIGKGWISLRYIEDGVNNSFMEEGTQHCRKIWLNCCQLTCRSYGSTVASI